MTKVIKVGIETIFLSKSIIYIELDVIFIELDGKEMVFLSFSIPYRIGFTEGHFYSYRSHFREPNFQSRLMSTNVYQTRHYHLPLQ